MLPPRKARLCSSARQYKKRKGLKKEDPRDNMTTLELVLDMPEEAAITETSGQGELSTVSKNAAIPREGGEAAGAAGIAAEERTGVPVIAPGNAPSSIKLQRIRLEAPFRSRITMNRQKTNRTRGFCFS